MPSASESSVQETPSTGNLLLRRPAVTTVVLLTALLTPLVAVPYALSRRRISHLAQQIDQLVATNAALHKSISKAAHDSALKKEELLRATSLLESSRKDISLLRRDISQSQAQLNALQSTTRTELQALLSEGKFARQRLDALPQLGLSLADVATFMHQVELHHGVPSSSNSQSVERLRSLALRLQRLSESPFKP